jgi:spore maturation protein CgeB
MLRILFLGENWYGSSARACCYALRRLGCDVMDVDVQTFFPQLQKRSSRGLLRVLRQHLVDEYNAAIVRASETFRPDLLLSFKAQHLRARTLRALRGQGIPLYNYYPDTSAFAHGPLLAESLPEYDCVFYTKGFWDRDVRRQVSLRESVYIPHGYDVAIHRPIRLEERDRTQYRADVVVIATHTKYKEEVLHELLTLRPRLKLAVWGNQWRQTCNSASVRQFVVGEPLVGDSYAKAIGAAKINLALLSGQVQGSSRGDETTTRTYEIPACGGFMLHARSAELLELYTESKEVACFSSARELAEKIDYYLAHPGEREAIARAGYLRCVPAYSYDNRMAEILRWHEQYELRRSKTAPGLRMGAKRETGSVDNNSELH